MICMCVTLDLEFPIAPIRSLSAPVRSRERQRRVRDMRVPRFFGPRWYIITMISEKHRQHASH